MATLAELLATKTPEQLFTELLAVLQSENVPVTAWQRGGALRSLTLADATVLSDLYLARQRVATGSYLESATGDWLSLHAASRYDVTRTPSGFAVGTMALACASGAGPYSINVAGLLVTDGTRRYRSTNTAAVNVASGGTASIELQAESPGTDPNIAAGTTLTIVSPASAGLSVTNPAIGATATWLTTPGADEESDVALRVRCRARWGTLGRGANDAAYVYLARTGHSEEAQVNRAAVEWGGGDGTLTVYIAGPAGPVSGSIVTVVQDWLDANKPGTDDVTVASVTAATIALLATIRVRAADDSTANRALATAALQAYVTGLDVGDDVDLGRLYEALYAAAGVIDADIVQPPDDVSVNNNQVATINVAGITWVAV